MRRLLLLCPVLLLLFAAPVAAGGPTSALITDPVSGRAAGLYYSQPAYGELQRLLGDAERLPERPAALGPAINVTWLIHDTEPWQFHQVHLDAAGGPVVATGDSWVRPAQGPALRRLLTQVLDRVLGGPLPSAAPPAPTSSGTPSAAVAGSERVVTETAWWSLTGWRWLVPGLAVGAAGALMFPRRRPDDREPRQVLVDVAP